MIIAISLGTDEVVGNIFVWFFIINSLLTIRVLIQFIIELKPIICGLLIFLIKVKLLTMLGKII
ncbi:hypothetical protein A7P85_02860 [Eikenella corrodens]|uniref:Uncharacterized protein n=1 Tax=Eikenella corrodens TaxID=539 RepID=A0A1A9RH26_EIKCO|nr:hypothetical protein A7P85_02860 [Eikenella corrodens]